MTLSNTTSTHSLVTRHAASDDSEPLTSKNVCASVPHVRFHVRECWEVFFREVVQVAQLNGCVEQLAYTSKERLGTNKPFIFGEFETDFVPLVTDGGLPTDASSHKIVNSGYCGEFWYLESKFWLASFVSNYPNLSSICPASHPIHFGMSEDRLHRLLNEVNISDNAPWVLKRDGASGASDVHFVSSSSQVLGLIEDAKELEHELPFICDRYPGIAGWSLQRHIDNPMLVRGGYKFHIRVQTIYVGNASYVYPYYEVRLAPNKFPGISDLHDTSAHITNGGGENSSHDRRWLAEEIPELNEVCELLPEFVVQFMHPPQGRPTWLPPSDGEDQWDRPELFTASNSTTGETTQSLYTTTSDECGTSDSELHNTHVSGDVTPTMVPFAMLAHDVMVSEDGNLALLETNHGPAAPPFEVDESGNYNKFTKHMVELSGAILDLLSFSGHCAGCPERYIPGRIVPPLDANDPRFFKLLKVDGDKR